ncbi:hypothetical protein RJZ57_005693 [Blastomyces gilchristii]
MQLAPLKANVRFVVISYIDLEAIKCDKCAGQLLEPEPLQTEIILKRFFKRCLAKPHHVGVVKRNGERTLEVPLPGYEERDGTVLKTSEHKFIIIRQRIISPTTLEGSPSLAVLAFLEILINRWGFLQMSGVIICCPVDQRLETSNSPGTRLSEKEEISNLLTQSVEELDVVQSARRPGQRFLLITYPKRNLFLQANKLDGKLHENEHAKCISPPLSLHTYQTRLSPSARNCA